MPDSTATHECLVQRQEEDRRQRHERQEEVVGALDVLVGGEPVEQATEERSRPPGGPSTEHQAHRDGRQGDRHPHQYVPGDHRPTGRDRRDQDAQSQVDAFQPAFCPTGKFCHVVKKGSCPCTSADRTNEIHQIWMISSMLRGPVMSPGPSEPRCPKESSVATTMRAQHRTGDHHRRRAATDPVRPGTDVTGRPARPPRRSDPVGGAPSVAIAWSPTAVGALHWTRSMRRRPTAGHRSHCIGPAAPFRVGRHRRGPVRPSRPAGRRSSRCWCRGAAGPAGRRPRPPRWCA